MPSFNADSNIQFQGDAKLVAGEVELNRNDLFRVGYVTYSEKVRLWDSTTGKLADFTTRFSFAIETTGPGLHGDGLAFFIAPVGFAIPANTQGIYMGLFNITNRYSSQIVAVEFDTIPNADMGWDPEYQHVGININSIESARVKFWNASLYNGETAYVSISYTASTKNLDVSWDYGANSSSLQHNIDLTNVLPEWVTIGFSGSTGLVSQRHILKSWEFNSNLSVKAINGDTSKVKKVIVSVVVSGSIFAIGATLTLLMLWKRRKIRKGITQNENLINADFERGTGPKRFSYGDLVLATNNFSSERKLGEGGFGCVYKGYLFDLDMSVAVKKISRDSRQGEKEYITEVKIISQLRHRNLVQLIGWCHDEGELILVYEFMPNGSLNTHLFDKKKHLTWSLRYKIALGLASSLIYLHEECEQCVIHRDIKPSNIMLDLMFNTKLGDFGLARLLDHELGPQTTGLAGTLGYMAPEYITKGQPTKESDIFSFGVVALEIVSGRKSTDRGDGKSQMGLVEWIWDLYGKRELLSSIDVRLQKDFNAKQVECLLIVGLWCAHPDHSLRPSIRQAIQVLMFEAPLPDLPCQMPVPIYDVPTQVPSVSDENPLTSTSITGR